MHNTIIKAISLLVVTMGLTVGSKAHATRLSDSLCLSMSGTAKVAVDLVIAGFPLEDAVGILERANKGNNKFDKWNKRTSIAIFQYVYVMDIKDAKQAQKMVYLKCKVGEYD